MILENIKNNNEYSIRYTFLLISLIWNNPDKLDYFKNELNCSYLIRSIQFPFGLYITCIDYYITKYIIAHEYTDEELKELFENLDWICNLKTLSIKSIFYISLYTYRL